MFMSAPMTDSASVIIAEATEAVPHEIIWSGPEGQIIIATWVLTMSTLLVGIIEIYRLIKIDHQLAAIRRMLFALTHPVITMRERKIVRRAHAHHVALAPTELPAEAKVMGRLVVIHSHSRGHTIRKTDS